METRKRYRSVCNFNNGSAHLENGAGVLGVKYML
jgi:hypothetical protein